MDPWDPEHGVDRELAMRLVGAQWPDLVGEPVHVGSGWDVDVWRFGDVAVRFPRRALGARCLDNELVVLPAIADVLPAPVPVPLRIGAPAFGYPARFYAHTFIPGTPMIRAALDDAALAALAAPLGAFLRALHALNPAWLRERGLGDDRRGDVARVAERGLGWLDRVSLDPALAAGARELLTGAMPATDAAPRLLHGDFHAANLLVGDGTLVGHGTLAGVIDWGDSAIGDPAIDLAAGWSIVPPAARDAFVAAYGTVSPATWARARINAVSRHALAILAWGEGRGDATVVAWARRSLARALSGDRA